MVDLQRVKDDSTKISLYEQYKKGEIKQAAIREVIKKEKNKSQKHKETYYLEMSKHILDNPDTLEFIYKLEYNKKYKVIIEEI